MSLNDNDLLDSDDMTLLSLRTTPIRQNRLALHRLPPPPPPRGLLTPTAVPATTNATAASETGSRTASLIDELERSFDGFEGALGDARAALVKRHVKVRNTVENFSRTFKNILEHEFNGARELLLARLKEHCLSKLKRLEFILAGFRADLDSLFNTKALRLSYLNDTSNQLITEVRITLFNLEKHEKIYFACPGFAAAAAGGCHGNGAVTDQPDGAEIDYMGRLFYTNAFDVYKKIKYLHLSRDWEEIRLIRPRDVIDDELNLNDMDNRAYLNHAFDNYPDAQGAAPLAGGGGQQPDFNENGAYANNPFDHNVRDEDYEIVPMSKTRVLYHMKKKDYSIIQVKIGDERGFLESELAFNSKRVVYNKFVANDKYILRAYLTDTGHFYVELFNERLSRLWIKRLSNALFFPFAITAGDELVFYSHATGEYLVHDLDFNRVDAFRLTADRARPFSSATLVKLTSARIYVAAAASTDSGPSKLRVLDRRTRTLIKEIELDYRPHLSLNSSFIHIDELNTSIVTKLENSSLLRYYDSDGKLLLENSHPFIKQYGHVTISKDGDIFYYDNSNNKMYVM